MSDLDRKKIEKILELLEEQRICLERAKLIMAELDKEWRIRLNEDWTVKT